MPAGGVVRDTLLLDHDERKSPRGRFVGLRGTAIEIALPPGQKLRHDDYLVLDDGGLIEIVARPEPLIEVRAHDVTALARVAWLLGDHHIPVELSERRLRVRPGAPVETLLQALDVTLRRIEAPFEPEGGAYDHAAQGNDNATV